MTTETNVTTFAIHKQMCSPESDYIVFQINWDEGRISFVSPRDVVSLNPPAIRDNTLTGATNGIAVG